MRLHAEILGVSYEGELEIRQLWNEPACRAATP
jgi:hypothetical protein